MNNTFILLRHAQTLIDLSIPTEKWKISEQGEKKIKKLVETGIFDDVELLFSSDEEKAVKTIEHLSKRIGKKPIISSSFREIYRGKENIQTQEKYERVIEKILVDNNFRYKDWESTETAINRFKKGILSIDERNQNRKILIVSHGLILTIYFANILKCPSRIIFERWKKTEFCGWGIVKDEKVIKDIV